MIGTVVGTALAGLVGLILLLGSFEWSFDLNEIGQIIKKGGHRAPIVMSFWLIQNADIFILSRFVDHDGARRLQPRLAARVRRLVPAPGLPHGDAPAAQVGRLRRLQGPVREGDGAGPAARLLLPRLHPRGADDGPVRRDPRRHRAGRLRRRRRPDPVHRRRLRDAGALPDDQPERQHRQQAAAVRRRRDRGGAPVHRDHRRPGGRDRRLRGAGRDDRRLRDPGHAAVHPRTAQQADRVPLPRGADRARARGGVRRRCSSCCRT